MRLKTNDEAYVVIDSAINRWIIDSPNIPVHIGLKMSVEEYDNFKDNQEIPELYFERFRKE